MSGRGGTSTKNNTQGRNHRRRNGGKSKNPATNHNERDIEAIFVGSVPKDVTEGTNGSPQTVCSITSSSMLGSDPSISLRLPTKNILNDLL